MYPLTSTIRCEDVEYYQNYFDMESTTQSINAMIEHDEEPLRIHNTDSESDAIKVEIEAEHKHLLGLIQKQDQISEDAKEVMRDPKKDPRFYCVGCGKVNVSLLCKHCAKKTIAYRIKERLESK